jgi:hypothetical protein
MEDVLFVINERLVSDQLAEKTSWDLAIGMSEARERM